MSQIVCNPKVTDAIDSEFEQVQSSFDSECEYNGHAKPYRLGDVFYCSRCHVALEIFSEYNQGVE